MDEDLGLPPNISTWLSGKSVFITGGSGYLGKVLIDKLLRGCDRLDKIYILIRGKKGLSCQQRWDELLKNSKAFDEIRSINPSLVNKIVCLDGDASLPKLGLRDEHRKILRENVSVIFHAAASVRFDQPLKEALKLNFRGTHEVLCLAKEMKNLEVMIHVSTAFTNCEHKVIKEEVYPPKMNWRKLITAIDRYDDREWNLLCDKLIGSSPNTYIFTKGLAENMVYDHKNELPVVIYRPSVVTTSFKDPIPGYCESLAGPNTIMIALALGITHIAIDNGVYLNYVPVDFTINGMIAAAWNHVQNRNTSHKAPLVYNSTNFAINGEETLRYGMDYMERGGVCERFWAVSFYRIQSWTLFQLLSFFLHFIPGVFVDGALGLLGKEKRFLKIYRTYYLAIEAVYYFMTTQFVIEKENFDNLRQKMLPEDIEIFGWDEIKDRRKFAENAFREGVKFVTKMDKVDLEKGKRNFVLFQRIHQVIKYGFFILVAWLLPFGTLFHYLMSICDVQD